VITGNIRYRLGWRNKMVLQVSYWARRFRVGHHPDYEPWVEYWRDATFQDVIDLQGGKVEPKSPAQVSPPPPPRPRGAHP
jgi:hypothetical protein